MTRHMRLSFVALLGAFLFLFAACGGGDDDGNDGVASIDDSDSDDSGDDDDGDGGGNGPSPEEQVKAEEAALNYVECMRGEGIDMPDPEFEEGGGIGIAMEVGEAGGPSQAELEAAEEKCGPLLEEGMPKRDMSPEEKAELQDQLLEMAQCMRDRGHDFEDPVVDDNGGVMIGGPAGGGDGEATGPPPNDEQFENDMEECNEEAGLGGGPGSRRTGSDDEDEDE